jgi:site-specific DNA-methyltransferase (adenine-specific)
MSGPAPFYQADGITLYQGDCRTVLPRLDLAAVDVVVTDPPYGETSLAWDLPVDDWLPLLAQVNSLWCFGSLGFFLDHAAAFRAAGWKHAQELVWEKHNGSNFHADRFRRVHELVVHFYQGRWAQVWKAPVTTPDATRRVVRRKARPPHHTGAIDAHTYTAVNGGPRLQRSVLRVRSCHGAAVHPTQKPLGIITPLLAHSCPPGGLVLDPFAGSGTTLVAAKLLGRRAVGIEREARYCELAARRLAQGVLDLAGTTEAG